RPEGALLIEAPMTFQPSSPDENYDGRHDLYHRRAAFRNCRELQLPTLPVLIRQSAALFCQLPQHPSGSVHRVGQRSCPRTATYT
ncbi:MAG: hypothetical protein ACO3S4_06145, partial [Pseudohongiellaceae bacterium]